MAAEIDAEIRRVLEECYERAKAMLREHMDLLNALTENLMRLQTINRAEFLALVETGSIPEGLGGDKPQPAAPVVTLEKKPEAPKSEPAPDKVTLPDDFDVLKGDGRES